MRCVLIGLGEIGRAVKEVYSTAHDIVAYDPVTQPTLPVCTADILLVAFPYSDTFVDDVRMYQDRFGPQATIVFSTVAIGTCAQLGAVHCPVEGRHPDLAESMMVGQRWLGGHDPLVCRFFEEAGMSYRETDKPEVTEFLKLRSTTVYGLNIELARYSKAVCDEIGMSYDECNDWDRWYNRLYADHFGMRWATRPILRYPEGPKGGHCVTNNARILEAQYPSPLVREVAEMPGVTEDVQPKSA